VFLIMIRFLVLVFFILISTLPLSIESQAQMKVSGINITGMERVWEQPDFRSKWVINQIQSAQAAGYSSIRLPIAVEYLLDSERRFLRELQKVVNFARDQNIELVLAYFGHELTDKNAVQKSETISKNWQTILKRLKGENSKLFLELANEPQLSPNVWESIWPNMVAKIRELDLQIPIIVGATNFNSLFELSRTSPLDLQDLIYTFHYYQPYIFTHQGTEWTGDQNATIGVPYPFQEGKMPLLDPKVRNTLGEINLRDYYQTGNKAAIVDKIGQIAAWAAQHHVTLWCTEYGASSNADPISRQAYLRDVEEVLNEFAIPGFVWEWEGNFGVNSLNLK
jgi:endoglucanase